GYARTPPPSPQSLQPHQNPVAVFRAVGDERVRVPDYFLGRRDAGARRRGPRRVGLHDLEHEDDPTDRRALVVDFQLAADVLRRAVFGYVNGELVVVDRASSFEILLWLADFLVGHIEGEY